MIATLRALLTCTTHATNGIRAKLDTSSELLDRIRAKRPDSIKAPDGLNDATRSYIVPGHRESLALISPTISAGRATDSGSPQTAK
ncbi:uncharacterized protein LAESUDRAFT_723562 [Laetiporus sulphureus 93-53]|uniref:Uncharacterized protein n=1 Tax=Laetiporus sulphureus 93-53 TaxID=1314785 RepID=A0A165FAA4_9APHY|nr:uncharacterized protein LAESUDRAFT_723562 [Laetiporus sulphureus 93-53]KZT08666.1 hypothetical protein LAESUDRAFT_723562 [Laetiporus sulphureus 93-53]